MCFTPQKLDGGHGFADGEPVADLLRRQCPQHDGDSGASHGRPFPALGLAPPAPRDRAPQPGGGAEGRWPPCCGGRRAERGGPGGCPRLRFPRGETRSCPGHSTKHGPIPVTTRSMAPSQSRGPPPHPSFHPGKQPPGAEPPQRGAACRCRPLPRHPGAGRSGREPGSAPPRLQRALPGPRQLLPGRCLPFPASPAAAPVAVPAP